MLKCVKCCSGVRRNISTSRYGIEELHIVVNRLDGLKDSAFKNKTRIYDLAVAALDRTSSMSISDFRLVEKTSSSYQTRACPR